MRRSRWCVDSRGFGCRLLSRVFRPTSTISLGVPRPSLPSTPLSVLIPVFDPVVAPIPVLVPALVLDLVPVHFPVTVFSLPSLGPGLLAACEMTVPDFLRVFPGVADSRALLPPPPLLLAILVSVPVSTPVPVPTPVPISTTTLVSVPALVPVPVLRPFSRLHPRPSLRPVPVPVPIPLATSRPSDPVPPSVQCAYTEAGPANGAVGCPQASLPFCRYDVACGMKVPAVKQKRIAAEGVLLPFPPLGAWTHLSVSPPGALPVLCHS